MKKLSREEMKKVMGGNPPDGGDPGDDANVTCNTVCSKKEGSTITVGTCSKVKVQFVTVCKCSVTNGTGCTIS